MEAQTSVLVKGAEHPNSCPWCGRNMAHFARSQRREPLESRLCIFYRAHLVKHRGFNDQVAGQPWRMTLHAGARVHGA
ncbi:hypothetical protein Hanom_Chr10g00964541 [Helianthus anomalus]